MPIDMSAATKAPPVKRATRTAPKYTPSSDGKQELRQEGLTGLAQVGQALCVAFGQYADAATIGKYGAPLAQEIAVLASQYDWLAKPVDYLIAAGPFAGLMAIAIPLGLQLAANHHRINPSAVSGMDIVPPEMLEAEMRAEIAKAQAAAIAKQKAAMEQAQRAQAEYEATLASMRVA